MELKIIINDLPHIVGRFIIQLEHEKFTTLNDLKENPDFWLDKRISFVTNTYDGNILEAGFYYSSETYTKEEYVKHFNNPHSKGKRYHRLLTSIELDWLFEHLKTRNY